MSLARLALRIATVIALRDATAAEGRVCDSSHARLDKLLERDAAPIITVATENSERKSGKQLPQVRLVIELAVQVRFPGVGAEDDPIMGYAATEAELDLMLDLIEVEILDALADSGGSPAAALWQRIVVGHEALRSPGTDYVSMRGIGDEGERLAARQIIVNVETMLDPVRGDDAPDWWTRFLALIATDPEYGVYHAMLSDFGARGNGRSAVWREMARMMMDQPSADALGLGEVQGLLDVDLGGVSAMDDERV